MDNSFSCTFKMKFKLWQCIRKININIKSLLILIQEKKLGFSLSAMRQIHFFGGYLCNVTLFWIILTSFKLYVGLKHSLILKIFSSKFIQFQSQSMHKKNIWLTSNLFLYFIFKPNHPPWKGSWMCTEWIIYVCWWHAICLFNMIADPCRTHYVH